MDLELLKTLAWGEAGALAYGLWMMIQAYKSVGAVGARSDALLNLALGAFIGPLAAAVFQSAVLSQMPKLDPRAVDVTLGVVAVPGLPRFIAWVQDRLMPKAKDDRK